MCVVLFCAKLLSMGAVNVTGRDFTPGILTLARIICREQLQTTPRLKTPGQVPASAVPVPHFVALQRRYAHEVAGAEATFQSRY